MSQPQDDESPDGVVNFRIFPAEMKIRNLKKDAQFYGNWLKTFGRFSEGAFVGIKRLQGRHSQAGTNERLTYMMEHLVQSYRDIPDTKRQGDDYSLDSHQHVSGGTLSVESHSYCTSGETSSILTFTDRNNNVTNVETYEGKVTITHSNPQSGANGVFDDVKLANAIDAAAAQALHGAFTPTEAEILRSALASMDKLPAKDRTTDTVQQIAELDMIEFQQHSAQDQQQWGQQATSIFNSAKKALVREGR